MASGDAHSKRKSIIKQFCSITGAEKDAAKRLLEVCHYNLEVAINMHVEADEAATSPIKVADDLPPPPPAANDNPENVRAPILPIKGVLVEPGYTGFRTRRRPAKSVFDGFRDFEAEAKQQEQELWNTASAASNEKRKTLEDLFRPPLDMMHRGTFDSARDLGQNTSRWLMVNIQNVQEFPCQVLNRDVWSNQAVKSIVKEHFVFWQVYHDSEEGERYMQFYKITEWPYVAVIDPRTGENLVVWTKLDAVTFCDLVSEFLTAHPSFDGLSAKSPPAKRQRLDSILDASEDSQLEAAIKASLMETSPVRLNSSCSTATEDHNRNVPTTTTMTDLALYQSLSAGVSLRTSDGEASAEESEEIEELETFESDSENSRLTASERNAISEKQSVVEDDTKISSESDTIRAKPEVDENWERHLGSHTDPKSSLVIRFPDGSKEHLNLPCTSKLLALTVYVQSKGFPEEKYELVTNFPRKQISMLNRESSLKDVGLFPQETIFVQLL